MKKKIVGFFVCMLLIATTLPAVGKTDEKTVSSTKIEGIPILDISEIKGGWVIIGINLRNYGDAAAVNIRWQINATGGLFFYPKSINGEVAVLEPGSDLMIKMRPAIGLGAVTIDLDCKYNIENLSCDTDIEIIQEWRDQVILFYNSFPQKIQPTKEWMDIMEYWYFDKTDTTGVGLYYGDLNNCHNVRVVSGSTNFSQELEFRAACKFTNGTAILTECGITQEIVESHLGHWEVELVDGG